MQFVFMKAGFVPREDETNSIISLINMKADKGEKGPSVL